MEISGDRYMNEDLRREIIPLRGSIVAAAERLPVPSRFEVRPHPDASAIVITDAATGREITVPLFAYGEVRRVLDGLFS